MIQESLFEIKGHVKVFSGIPKNLLKENQYKNIDQKYKEIKVETIYDDHNIVVNIARQELLQRTIVETPVSNPITVNWMGIGDGGYDYSALTILRPHPSDTSLGNMIDLININSYQPMVTSGNSCAIVMSSTFFSAASGAGTSEDVNDFNASNVNKFINEAGLFWNDGTTENKDLKLFSKISMGRNLPFAPESDFAITFQWSIIFK